MESNVAELARAEAARAEAESPDEPEGEPEPEPSPTDEPEAVAAPLAAVDDEAIKKAERAIEAQRRKLAGILGADYVQHDCLLCSGLGFLPEMLPPGTTLELVEQNGGVALDVRAPQDLSHLQTAKDKGECDECDGYGWVISGSKVAHALTVTCSKCSGNGWMVIARDTPPLPDAFAASYNGPMMPNPAEREGVIDAWGRPAGHQHWGVPPASIPG